MKVEILPMFVPVVITVETQRELDALLFALNECVCGRALIHSHEANCLHSAICTTLNKAR
jgi:hypothetical protein